MAKLVGLSQNNYDWLNTFRTHDPIKRKYESFDEAFAKVRKIVEAANGNQ